MNKTLAALALTLSLLSSTLAPGFAYSEGTVLKPGMRHPEVTELQQDLAKLGYFNTAATGYYGSVTKSAVLQFQKAQGLTADGVAGVRTIGKITGLLQAKTVVSRGGVARTETPAAGNIQLLSWYDEVERIYGIGDVATVIDVATGLKMQVKRTFGGNHADVETLTAEDTAILKKAAGGSWNWTRRPVIVEVGGYRIAGSMTAMPHAGRDDQPAVVVVDNRSGGYGRGQNLDAVKGNEMDGQFDIHFLNSRTHSTNKVDSQHQDAIRRAFESGL